LTDDVDSRLFYCTVILFYCTCAAGLTVWSDRQHQRHHLVTSRVSSYIGYIVTNRFFALSFFPVRMWRY